MSERFECLYRLPDTLFSFDAHIIVDAGTLLRDTKSGKVIVQLKFTNVSASPIKTLKLSITGYDVAGVPLGDIVQYQYLDLKINNGQSFGADKAIIMNHELIRSFNICELTVVREDNSIHSTSMPFAKLPKPESLKTILGDYELLRQYKLEINDEAFYRPVVYSDVWMCSCGKWNNGDVCAKCNATREKVFLEFEMSSLIEKKNSRIADDKAKMEEQVLLDSGDSFKAIKTNEAIDPKYQVVKAINKKKILILAISIFAILVLLGGLLLSTSWSISDEKISHVLAEGLENRLLLPPASGNIAEFKRLVDAEYRVLKYSEKAESIELQTYMTGLQQQRESLQYFESDPEYFWKLWLQGQDKRYYSVLLMVSSGDLEISDDTYDEISAQYWTRVLADSIGSTIAGDVTYKWDEKKQQYYFETTLTNVTDLTLENIVLNLIMGNEINTCRTDKWEAGEKWKIRTYMDQETLEAIDVDLDVQFVKYKFNNYILDNSTIFETED